MAKTVKITNDGILVDGFKIENVLTYSIKENGDKSVLTLELPIEERIEVLRCPLTL